MQYFFLEIYKNIKIVADNFLRFWKVGKSHSASIMPLIFDQSSNKSLIAATSKPDGFFGFLLKFYG